MATAPQTIVTQQPQTPAGPTPDPGGPDGPGTANAAAKQLEQSAEKPSILNDEEVDLNDETSQRTVGKEGEEKEGEAPASDYNPGNLKFPDGFKPNMNDPLLNDFSSVTKKHNLSQEAAQDYVDLYTKSVKSAADKPYQLWRDTQKGWQNEVMADQELGGKNFNNVKRVIGSALNEYGDPGVKAALDFTGAGNNPAIIRTLYRMSQALAEPAPVPGEPPKPQKPDSPGAALYPHLIKNRGD